MDILTQNNRQSMTSQQIAELVCKRHDNVRRAVQTLAVSGVIRLPQIEDVKNHQGQTVRVDVFSGEQGKRDSIIVVAQLSPEFTAALVDRWQELEQQVSASNPVTPAIPQSFAEALQLAADQAKQLELAAPKVDAYDRLIDSTHLKTVGAVAKSIGLRSAQALNDKLDTVKAYDGRCADRVWSGWFVEQGLGRMITTPDGYSSNKMTGKGQAWALDLFGGAK